MHKIMLYAIIVSLSTSLAFSIYLVSGYDALNSQLLTTIDGMFKQIVRCQGAR